jgi:hypothetical protein
MRSHFVSNALNCVVQRAFLQRTLERARDRAKVENASFSRYSLSPSPTRHPPTPQLHLLPRNSSSLFVFFDLPIGPQVVIIGMEDVFRPRFIRFFFLSNILSASYVAVPRAACTPINLSILCLFVLCCFLNSATNSFPISGPINLSIFKL